jgi:hypothetical protein
MPEQWGALPGLFIVTRSVFILPRGDRGLTGYVLTSTARGRGLARPKTSERT